MRKEFAINIAFLLFINLLIKPFFIFGIDLSVQNRTGEDYGLYFALFSFAYLFQILNDFGIQNFNNQTISQHPQMLPKYFPNLLLLKAVMGFVYFAVTITAAFFIAGYGQQELPLLAILLGNQVLIQFIFFFRSNISGLGHFRTDSILSSMDKLLMIFTCGFVLWVNPIVEPFSIYHFAFAQTVALVLTLIVAIFAFKKYLTVPLKLRMRKAFVWSLFRKSVPFALVILLMGAFTRLDAVLLERLLPDGKMQAEVYAGAYRLLDAANMFGFLFASLLLPMFARILKKKESVLSLVRLSSGLLWLGSITLCVTVYFARTGISDLMYKNHLPYRAETLGYLIWAFVAVCSTYVFSTLLTADGRLMRMNRFFFLTIFLNVGLCLWWIPAYKAVGASWAAVATQFFVAVGMIGLCLQEGYFSFKDLGFGRLLLFAVCLLTFAFFVFEKISLDWYIQAILVLFAGGLGSLALFFPEAMAEFRKIKEGKQLID